VRQPILELGATAFDVLYAKISTASGGPDVVLPVELIVRESCGCPHRPVAGASPAAPPRSEA
jgi:DNA-binding LacI/PurR family transcriptional regulator